MQYKIFGQVVKSQIFRINCGAEAERFGDRMQTFGTQTAEGKGTNLC